MRPRNMRPKPACRVRNATYTRPATPGSHRLGKHSQPMDTGRLGTLTAAPRSGQLLGVDRNILPVAPHDKALGTEIEALIKAFE